MVKRVRDYDDLMAKQKISSRNIDEIEAESIKTLKQALYKSGNPVVAYSGGKDAIVVAHMANKLGVKNFVCETSFYFKQQLESIKSISEKLGLNVTYKCGLPKDWLKRNPKAIFSNDTKYRAYLYAIRQQKTVKRFAKEIGADLQIFGRRTEENSVPKSIYKTKSGLQCHPIRDWSTYEVWNYFEKHKIPIPFIYSQEFSKSTGNAPWYTINPDHVGGVNECWRIVRKIEPSLNPEDYK